MKDDRWKLGVGQGERNLENQEERVSNKIPGVLSMRAHISVYFFPHSD